MSEAFLAAKSLAEKLEAQWQQQFAKFSCGMIIKDAPDPKGHFEIHVRSGTIVVLCRTATANGWHRIRRLAGKQWDGVAVSVAFEPIRPKDGNYHSPEPVERPCEGCGEPTLNKRLCRDCGIEEALDGAQCSECAQFIFNAWAAKKFGVERAGHSESCSRAGEAEAG
ncbi:MAG TPA: hypothetical protein VFR23_25100 [Jiangellaceae bacterium]|nr:hypothetical protein [Jiangellaceae bacterium]